MKIFFFDPNNNTPQYSYPLLELMTKKDIKAVLFSTKSTSLVDYYDENYHFTKTYLFASRISRLKKIKMRKFLKFFSFPIHYFQFLRLLFLKKPDILHINWLAAPVLDFFLIRVARFLSIPVLINVHNFKPHDSTQLRFMERKAYENATALICFSKFVSTMLKKSHHHVFIVNHGNVYKKERVKWNFVNKKIENDKFTLLFLGGIRPYKGIEVLFRALPLAQEQLKNLKLIIAGPGEKAYCSNLKKLIDFFDLDELVEFIPSFQNYEDMISLVQISDCGILPYQESSQSGVIYLFQEYSKPVIITNVGGLPEQVSKKTAIVSEPYAHTIANAIVQMKEKIKDLVKTDFEEINKENDLRKSVKTIIGIYEKVQSGNL